MQILSKHGLSETISHSAPPPSFQFKSGNHRCKNRRLHCITHSWFQSHLKKFETWSNLLWQESISHLILPNSTCLIIFQVPTPSWNGRICRLASSGPTWSAPMATSMSSTRSSWRGGMSPCLEPSRMSRQTQNSSSSPWSCRQESWGCSNNLKGQKNMRLFFHSFLTLVKLNQPPLFRWFYAMTGCLTWEKSLTVKPGQNYRVVCYVLQSMY